MTNIIATDLQSQEILSGLVDLYVLEFGDNNSSVLYFHPGVGSDLSEITFRDINSPYTTRTYVALPLELKGMEVTGDGAPSRPVLTVANVLTKFRTELGDINADDIVGARLTRRRTLEKYLSTGSATTPPTEFPIESYIVDRVLEENSLYIKYELANPFDLNTIQLPRRVVVGKYCSWVYRGLDSTFTATHKLCGACHWNPNRGGDKRTYYTEYNEHLIKSTSVSHFNNGTSYNVGDLTKLNNLHYIAIRDSQGENPEDLGSAYWEIVYLYEVWSSISGGHLITVGEYVEHGNTVWKCVRQHYKQDSKTPNVNSRYWTPGDVCQKTLEACKTRFGSNHTSSGRVNGVITERALPFGAFPGSDKFR